MLRNITPCAMLSTRMRPMVITKPIEIVKSTISYDTLYRTMNVIDDRASISQDLRFFQISLTCGISFLHYAVVDRFAAANFLVRPAQAMEAPS